MPANRDYEELRQQLAKAKKWDHKRRREFGTQKYTEYVSALTAQLQRFQTPEAKEADGELTSSGEEGKDDISAMRASSLSELSDSDSDPEDPKGEARVATPDDQSVRSQSGGKHARSQSEAENRNRLQKRRLDHHDIATINPLLLQEGMKTDEAKNRIAQLIPFFEITKFQAAYHAARLALSNEDEVAPNSVDQNDQNLYYAVVALQNRVVRLCKEEGVTEEVVDFPSLITGGAWYVGSQIHAIAAWLHTSSVAMALEPPKANEIVKEVIKEVVKVVEVEKEVIKVVVEKAKAAKDDNGFPKVYLKDSDGEKTLLSQDVASQSRRNPRLFLDCVTKGRDVATSIFTLRTGGTLCCLSCNAKGSKGERLKAADALRKWAGQQHGEVRIDCGCLLDLALLELWIVKVSSGNEDVPQRVGKKFALEIDKEVEKAAHFGLSEVNLKQIAAIIEDLTGIYRIDDLLQPRADRIEKVARFTLDKLAEIHASQDIHELLPAVRSQLDEAMRRIREGPGY